MHFTTLFTSALVAISTVAALPAAPCPTTTKSSPKPTSTVNPSYRLQVRTANVNPAVDKLVQGQYITINTFFQNSLSSGLTADAKLAPQFTFLNNETKIKWNNNKSLVLTDLYEGQTASVAAWENGVNHNELVPYPIRGGHCFGSKQKGFKGWSVCGSQYGAYLGWFNDKFDLKEYNKGAVFGCTVVELCQDLVV